MKISLAFWPSISYYGSVSETISSVFVIKNVSLLFYFFNWLEVNLHLLIYIFTSVFTAAARALIGV